MDGAAEKEPTDKAKRYRVEIAQLSDVGRVRTENQDFATSTEPADRSQRGQVMVVADGMGGHKGGATASKLSATMVRDEYLASAEEDVAEALRAALLSANQAIHQKAKEDRTLEGMGTTTSAMVVRESKVWIAHVGDSRVYRIRDGAIEQMTEDHSLVATMVKEGLISAEEAETHPRKNVLQRSMGVASEVEVDVYGPFDLQEGDYYLGCSDGLHGQVKPEEILDIISAGQKPEAIARRLVDLALERGAPDNVTVVIGRAIEDDGSLPEGAELIPRADDDTLRGEAPPVEKPDTDAPSARTGTGGSGCVLHLILVALLVAAVAGSVAMLIDEQAVISLFQRSP